MHIIHTQIGAPQLKIVKKENSAVLVMTPLPTGYAVTIGNSLRRGALSSLSGAAVTGFKIPGITHEYTTIPGIKESVLDISLNLRALKLKKHTADVEFIKVPFVKTGKVTAKDLKISSNIEIIDPTQVIMTCQKADAGKSMELQIEKGVGYRLITNEDAVKNTDPELILIDANFSPVSLVKYSVEPARVGELTNLDKLTFELETDGSVDPEKAIKQAANILQRYFELFNVDDAYVDEDFITSFEQLKKQKKSEEMAAEEAKDMAFTPIDILGLSQRTLNALVNGNITSVEELMRTPLSHLSQLRGFGQKARTELDQVLIERGYLQTNKDIKNISK